MAQAMARFPWRVLILGLLSAVLYALGNHWQPALKGSSHLLYVLWFSCLFALYVVALR